MGVVTRKAILVLGMHRSGTSAVTGVLIRLGATAPRTLLPAAEDNPLGFWESAPFVDFNDRLLRAAGTDWDLWSRPRLERLASETRSQFEREFETLLDGEFGEAPLFVIKDPRICRLAPFWIQQLQTRGINVAVAIVVRPAFEVARSLVARDGIAVEHAALLWLRHVLESERDTRHVPRVMLRYEDVLSDWRAVANRVSSGLGVEWLPTSADMTQAIDDFVQPRMRHHVAGGNGLDVGAPLSHWITSTWDALELLRSGPGGTSEAYGALDAVRADLDALTPAFELIVGNERRLQQRRRDEMQSTHAAERSQFHERLAAVEWARDQLGEQLAHVESGRDELRQRVGHLEGEVSRLQGEVLHLTAERAAFATQVSQLGRQRDDMRDREASLTFQLGETKKRSEWVIESLTRRAQEAENHVEALRQSLSWRVTAPLRQIRGWLQVLSRRIG